MSQDQEYTQPNPPVDTLISGQTIRGSIIHHIDFSQISAYDLTFVDCTIADVNFTDAELEGLTCKSVKFINCDFLDANLTDASFENCTFFDGDTSTGCRFLRTNLTNGTFKNCDISGCHFEGAKLTRLLIQESKAIGTQFFRANMNQSARIVNSNLRYADLRRCAARR